MRRALLVLAAVLLSTVSATAEDGDAIVGRWLTEPSTGGHAHVDIVKVGGSYSGRIVWVEIPLYPPDDEQGMGGSRGSTATTPTPPATATRSSASRSCGASGSPAARSGRKARSTTRTTGRHTAARPASRGTC